MSSMRWRRGREAETLLQAAALDELTFSLETLVVRAAHLVTGVWGERQAAAALKKKGYRLLGRRVRMGRRDEIDLVARDGSILVFVEVKTRAEEAFGRPVSAVDRRKRRAVSRAAVRYLRALRSQPEAFRFDVVEVIGSPGGRDPVIRHIPNAFALDRRYDVPV